MEAPAYLLLCQRDKAAQDEEAPERHLVQSHQPSARDGCGGDGPAEA